MNCALAVAGAVLLAACDAAAPPSTPGAGGSNVDGGEQSDATARSSASASASAPDVRFRGCDTLSMSAASVATAEVDCGRNVAEGCGHASAAYLCGVGVPKDVGKAAELGARACDGGALAACAVAGSALLLGDGDPASPARDPERAERLLRVGCTGGDNGSCNDLGTLYMLAGPMHSGPKALSIFEPLCTNEAATDGAMACGNAALLYLQAPDVPHDRARAALLAQTACDRDVPTGCNTVGVLAATAGASDGGTKDLTRARTFYAKACKLNDPEGCANLGTAEQKGTGGPVDIPAAKAAYDQACRGGNAFACRKLDQLGR